MNETRIKRACRAAEHERAAQLEGFRSAFPEASVGVECLEGCLLVLVVRWADDTTYYSVCDGTAARVSAAVPRAGMPSDKAGAQIATGGWGTVVREDDTDEEAGALILRATINGQPFWSNKRWWSQYPRHALTDERVIDAIRDDRRRRGHDIDWDRELRALLDRV
jgi:hypothetical protein